MTDKFKVGDKVEHIGGSNPSQKGKRGEIVKRDYRYYTGEEEESYLVNYEDQKGTSSPVQSFARNLVLVEQTPEAPVYPFEVRIADADGQWVTIARTMTLAAARNQHSDLPGWIDKRVVDTTEETP